MPALSPTMEDGAISSWMKKEGDEVSAGEALCEIETDKATVDFELADDGVLAKILVKENVRVKVGDVIGILVDDTADVAAFANTTLADFTSSSSTKEQISTQPEPKVEQPAYVPSPSKIETNSSNRIFISPLARKLAKDNEIDISSLKGKGTGPKGRIIASDITSNLNQTTTQTQTVNATPTNQKNESNFADQPLSFQELANNLTISKKEAPHYYLVSEIKLNQVLKLRQEFKDKYDIDLSINDFIVKASATAMKSTPVVNASFRSDFVRIFHNTDINLYTQESVGIIRKCNTKGLTEISQESAAILENAETKLDLGTFAIINLGKYGVKKVFPIVLHGQSACLGVGEITKEYEPFHDESGELNFTENEIVNVSLSCDHRVVDGAIGAQWLQKFKQLLEDPSTLLL